MQAWPGHQSHHLHVTGRPFHPGSMRYGEQQPYVAAVKPTRSAFLATIAFPLPFCHLSCMRWLRAVAFLRAPCCGMCSPLNGMFAVLQPLPLRQYTTPPFVMFGAYTCPPMWHSSACFVSRPAPLSSSSQAAYLLKGKTPTQLFEQISRMGCTVATRPCNIDEHCVCV
jgi:hypothetical protein